MEFRSPKSAAPTSSTLRAFAVLELIARAEAPPTLETLTRACDLPKPTVHRILGLLMRGGLVQRDAFEKRYGVGPRAAGFALEVQMRSPDRAERHAVLARLVEEIGETCNLTMPDGDKVVYLDRVETAAKVRLHMDIGSRVPMHCTASGKLFLAHLPAARVRRILGPGPLKRFTERTATSVAALERELRRIRASGIGTDSGEFLDGSVCLAVPVKDPLGRICAAVAVHGPAPRMTLRKGHEFLPAMRRAAGEIAATLAAPH
ncbi:MAG: IclR family transcriptional regulator [Betaproteobacteria bacterium]|nr:MAG: IclR family transcriptional regulator [Betaproteobacteria bacterium]